MRWDFNNYYSHSVDGLISKLKLGKSESDKLKRVRLEKGNYPTLSVLS